MPAYVQLSVPVPAAPLGDVLLPQAASPAAVAATTATSATRRIITYSVRNGNSRLWVAYIPGRPNLPLLAGVTGQDGQIAGCYRY